MVLVPERRTRPELLDLPGDAHPDGELAGSLSDIRRVNLYLGGTKAVLEHFSAMAGGLDKGEAVTVLDLATGSADIPVAVVEWARGRGMDVRVTAVDVNPAVVEHAREVAGSYPEITLSVADALDLGLSDKSFDFVLCSMALHHFSEDDSRRLLKSIAAIARRGYIVGDLRRSWIAYGLTCILSRVCTTNRLTRCDGPLSVLRSYTCRELDGLAREAGLRDYRVVMHPFWRMALVGGEAWAKR